MNLSFHLKNWGEAPQVTMGATPMAVQLFKFKFFFFTTIRDAVLIETHHYFFELIFYNAYYIKFMESLVKKSK